MDIQEIEEREFSEGCYKSDRFAGFDRGDLDNSYQDELDAMNEAMAEELGL